MLNQKERINEVMSRLQDYAKIPNGIFTSNEIYRAFKDYGITSNLAGKPLEEETKQQILLKLNQKENEGKCWIGSGSLSDEWQFFDTNIPRDGRKPNYEWKVYIPINPAYYGFVAPAVINFLCDNGIVSHSKISGSIRSDSMVINLENEEDVTKLNVYISKNKVVSSCLGVHQPFIPDFDGIGVVHTFDDDTSYTERLSNYLTKFLNYCKAQNRLDWISVDGFLASMQNSLNNNMVQHPEEIKQIIEHMNVILNDASYIPHEGQKHETERRM